MEGDSVTLNSGLTEIRNEDLIQWMLGNENTLIAEINKQVNRFTVYDDVLDGRFRDRLKLDNQTGSLTITNTTTEHEGVYELQINFTRIVLALTVYQEKSAMEGDSVTLNSGLTEIRNDEQIQWIFGNELTLIAIINKQVKKFTVFDDVLDGRFRSRLKLDNQTGSLTITNIRIEDAGFYKLVIIGSKPSLKTFHVSVYDSVHCCGPTGAVIRLVLSALVGVATVILLVYDIRSRRAEQDKAHIHTSGVFGDDVVSVNEGDSFSLNSGLTEIMDDDVIQWRFGNENTLIAEVNKQIDSMTVYDDVLNGRFRDRLKLDNQTGSLTITNITTEHAGNYELQTNSLRKCYRLTVHSEISVMEGDSVTLNNHLTEILSGALIEWWFENENTLLALIKKETNTMFVRDDVLDGRFRDRLKLDNQTGSLTITNTRPEHAGRYKVNFNTMIESFSLTVNARLLVPVISSNSLNSSTSSLCSLVCSVVNVSHVTLSWYKGNSVLSSTSASDLSISLSLPLEIERLDDSYSCVVAYSFTNQTTHLNTELCHTCSDSVHCCGSTEAVIRLVLSALVGVATVILLVYDIRSRRAEQDQAHIQTSQT
ncbi:uncharacterized protein [Garra rufa]|uniref:uncharacterized protein n=1 Tax=Garra rufa TaxID=137080 RepID=UPI003CCE8C6C